MTLMGKHVRIGKGLIRLSTSTMPKIGHFLHIVTPNAVVGLKVNEEDLEVFIDSLNERRKCSCGKNN